jgi:hypothetical protein
MHVRKTTLALMTGLLLLGTWLSSTAVEAQDLHPSRRPSPVGIARTFVGDTYVKVVYSSPYKRGRDNIFGTEDSGALVPYGKIWRTGANEATEITLTGDLLIGDQKLPAGTYSIFTVPGPEQWSVQFNSALGLSGTGRFDMETRKFEPADLPATEVLSLTAPVASLDEEVDQFTFAFDTSDTGTGLCLRWITTEVCVPIAAAE